MVGYACSFGLIVAGFFLMVASALLVPDLPGLFLPMTIIGIIAMFMGNHRLVQSVDQRA